MSVVHDSELDGMRVRATIRCGGCGTWRRVPATVWAFEGYRRRLEWDRQEMASALTQLDAERPPRRNSPTSSGPS